MTIVLTDLLSLRTHISLKLAGPCSHATSSSMTSESEANPQRIDFMHRHRVGDEDVKVLTELAKSAADENLIEVHVREVRARPCIELFLKNPARGQFSQMETFALVEDEKARYSVRHPWVRGTVLCQSITSEGPYAVTIKGHPQEGLDDLRVGGERDNIELSCSRQSRPVLPSLESI